VLSLSPPKMAYPAIVRTKSLLGLVDREMVAAFRAARSNGHQLIVQCTVALRIGSWVSH
jgi:hypothetical protein